MLVRYQHTMGRGKTDCRHIRLKVDPLMEKETTHLAPGEAFKIPGYSVYRNDRPSRTAAGDVAIIIKRHIEHHEVNIDTENRTKN